MCFFVLGHGTRQFIYFIACWTWTRVFGLNNIMEQQQQNSTKCWVVWCLCVPPELPLCRRRRFVVIKAALRQHHHRHHQHTLTQSPYITYTRKQIHTAAAAERAFAREPCARFVGVFVCVSGSLISTLAAAAAAAPTKRRPTQRPTTLAQKRRTQTKPQAHRARVFSAS